MIVDSSALPEQAVRDVVLSAFDSAGQRCSAARLLFVQEDIADKLITMLKGAIAELKVGDPADYATDVGPVIDEDARRGLDAHKDRMRREARHDHRARAGAGHRPRHLRGAGRL
jgi:RHH-type transcriptional regulator, proline utilization regulon repressor / proline dehydrogenase / delta 1-pyrroline-5-carboxylate dehydrogenase